MRKRYSPIVTQAGTRRVEFPVEETRRVRNGFWNHIVNSIELYECRGTIYISGQVFILVYELINWQLRSVVVQARTEPDNSPGTGTLGGHCGNPGTPLCMYFISEQVISKTITSFFIIPACYKLVAPGSAFCFE